MNELLGQAANAVIWAVLVAVPILFVLFFTFPKRTRKTVNYVLNAYAEYKQAKEHPEEKIEVPDFETKGPMPKVPHPKEKKP